MYPSKISYERLVIHWMDRQPAPLDLLACTPVQKVPVSVECLANGLMGTGMCRLPNCDNQADHPESEDELDYEELDDDLEY